MLRYWFYKSGTSPKLSTKILKHHECRGPPHIGSYISQVSSTLKNVHAQPSPPPPRTKLLKFVQTECEANLDMAGL